MAIPQRLHWMLSRRRFSVHLLNIKLLGSFQRYDIYAILCYSSFPFVVVWDHDDVIKWKHYPCYWPFVLGIHRSPVNSPHKGQWLGALMFSLICAWISGWVNNREAGYLRRHRAHYDVTVMTAISYVSGQYCFLSHFCTNDMRVITNRFWAPRCLSGNHSLPLRPGLSHPFVSHILLIFSIYFPGSVW